MLKVVFCLAVIVMASQAKTMTPVTRAMSRADYDLKPTHAPTALVQAQKPKQGQEKEGDPALRYGWGDLFKG